MLYQYNVYYLLFIKKYIYPCQINMLICLYYIIAPTQLCINFVYTPRRLKKVCLKQFIYVIVV